MESNAITKIVPFDRLNKEQTSDEIKVFAESTMNELLGWYGYEAAKDSSKLSRTTRSNSGSNDSETDSIRFSEGCGWCGKPVDENKGLTSGIAVFCSELCFSQSRRANFKKNKTCDWCRHVRHTVSYVDFQDGVSQLQFCSDKCLNQYKMHIFCRETRAHLEMHPHLIGDTDSTSGVLITPDLWLRNCKSPSPVHQSIISPEVIAKFLPESQIEQNLPLPLKNVVHSTKLLSNQDRKKRPIIKFNKRNKRRCSYTITSETANNTSNETPQDLRIRHTPPREYPKSSYLCDNKAVEPVVDLESVDISDTKKEENEQGETKIPNSTVKAILNNLLPPQTVFVPYPVILPLPITIPIPIPLPKMIKIQNDKEVVEIKSVATQTDNYFKINVDSRSCVRKSPRKRKLLIVDQRSRFKFRSKKTTNNKKIT